MNKKLITHPHPRSIKNLFLLKAWIRFIVTFFKVIKMNHSIYTIAYNYAWLGLYNTGTVGNFAWVTGEPVSFTNWIPGEPNNLYNEPANATVF